MRCPTCLGAGLLAVAQPLLPPKPNWVISAQLPPVATCYLGWLEGLVMLEALKQLLSVMFDNKSCCLGRGCGAKLKSWAVNK